MPSIPSSLSVVFAVSYLALWVLVILEGFVVLGLLRLTDRLPAGDQKSAIGVGRSSDGHIIPGHVAPTFTAMSLAREPITTAAFAGSPWALLFVSPLCRACVTTMAELKAIEGKVQGNLIVICRADAIRCEELVDPYSIITRTVADSDDRISHLYGISDTPTAVLIDGRNRVEKYGTPMREEMADVFGGGQTANMAEGD